MTSGGDECPRGVENRGMNEVLVVDDDALIRGLLTEWRSETGCRLRQAENGASALKMRRGQPVGQPVADMDMPSRAGVRTLDEERLKPPGLSVIATSSGARDEVQTGPPHRRSARRNLLRSHSIDRT